MKISNETKVGAITAIAITVLILGFNFLKGKNLGDRSNVLYAIFPSVEGLLPSSPVYINGFQVGKVTDMRAKDMDLSAIIVKISLSKPIHIPDNSVAVLNSEILQSTTVIIRKGTSNNYINDGDTIQTQANPSLMGEVRNSLNPVISSINRALISLDALIGKVNTVIDPRTQNNLQSTIANLNTASQSLTELLNAQNGVLARTLANAESFTANIKNNNGKIDTILDNAKQVSEKLASLKLSETLATVNKTLNSLDAVMAKLNSKEGTAGLLLNDTKLYEELRQTNRSLNTLLDDFRTHPKRYVNVSVFGRKDKTGALQKPIYDSVPN